jgi:hypothetical protein
MDVGEELFDAKVKVLGEYVDHTCERKKTSFSPRCRNRISIFRLG